MREIIDLSTSSQMIGSVEQVTGMPKRGVICRPEYTAESPLTVAARSKSKSGAKGGGSIPGKQMTLYELGLSFIPGLSIQPVEQETQGGPCRATEVYWQEVTSGLSKPDSVKKGRGKKLTRKEKRELQNKSYGPPGE